MAKTEKDARLIEYKDTISQLNMTIKSQNEIILSLKETIASNQEQMRIMTEKIDYLSHKLFGTSSEKTQNLEGQYSLFDEADRETERITMPQAILDLFKEGDFGIICQELILHDKRLLVYGIM